ncbi:MAG: hypothetical protein ACYC2U_07235 [Candidatus Amoebophilus sp.]
MHNTTRNKHAHTHARTHACWHARTHAHARIHAPWQVQAAQGAMSKSQSTCRSPLASTRAPRAG